MTTTSAENTIFTELKDKTNEIRDKIAVFDPITLDEVNEILSLTIKKDDTNKLIVFLAALSTYTENNQFNVALNSPSSSGKTYIPLETANFFPKEDVVEIGYCSPTAFFHDWGYFDKENKRFYVNLERKILIFLDQPQTLLMERLRPLLSHDRKEIEVKITDKGKKQGMKTKNIIVRGFSTVFFCSATQVQDEQEATRFILLSPEVTDEKVRLGVQEAIKLAADPKGYYDELNAHPGRKALMERIRAIKAANIQDINLHDPSKIEERFVGSRVLKPRHQRDIKRIISLIKAHALLNLWQRANGMPGYLITNDDDVDAGFNLWEQIAYSQELNLSPYVYGFWKDIIVSAWEQKNDPITRKDIIKTHNQVYGRPIEINRLNREIIPLLENSGLIEQIDDPDDKRKKLITPLFNEQRGAFLGAKGDELEAARIEKIKDLFDAQT